jgi:uncharacterized iron-regulated protein
MNARLSVLVAACCAFGAGCTSSWTGVPDTHPVPVRPTENYRVVESATGQTVPFSAVIARAASADVVFFGEQHDDPETHFLEFALLEGLGQRTNGIVLSLEMFERDVQPELNRFLAGAQSESTFLAKARPWPRYATDYRPMVQLARARGWPVIAANIPRALASAISRKGLTALDTLTVPERAYASGAMVCPPNTPYFARFSEAMGGMGGHGPGAGAADAAAAQAQLVRVYEAQCAKDETMAESIAASRGTGLVFHVNGAFHSDYRQGTAERLRRRAPGARILVVTALPVESPATAVIGAEGAKADYVIFTRKP